MIAYDQAGRLLVSPLGTLDTFTRGGAEWLAKRITAFWEGRGYTIRTWIEKTPTPIGEVFVVRSDLVGGRPNNAR